MFELHLLESGISGGVLSEVSTADPEFELHLLESGISGGLQSICGCKEDSSLNSTYWNLVFQALRLDGGNTSSATFELHLLESGISGPLGWNDYVYNYVFELHLLESGISGVAF